MEMQRQEQRDRDSNGDAATGTERQRQQWRDRDRNREIETGTERQAENTSLSHSLQLVEWQMIAKRRDKMKSVLAAAAQQEEAHEEQEPERPPVKGKPTSRPKPPQTAANDKSRRPVSREATQPAKKEGVKTSRPAADNGTVAEGTKVRRPKSAGRTRAGVGGVPSEVKRIVKGGGAAGALRTANPYDYTKDSVKRTSTTVSEHTE